MVRAGMETSKSRTTQFNPAREAGVSVTHTIHFRRPETPYSLSKMTVLNSQEASTQIHRLKALGYAIIEVLPPLDGGLTATP